MGRQRTPIQVNQFVGGLNTEANPLNFPPTASIDEQNMDINRDGSRQRRLGHNFETDYIEQIINMSKEDGVIIGRNQFLWENTGGTNTVELMVVQIGNYVAIHDLNSTPLSTAPIFTKTFSINTYTTNFDFAVVDGLLVITTGEKVVYVLTYDNGTITVEEKTLLIRDLFGVEAPGDALQITDTEHLQYRPSNLSAKHLYNLRNQTFALPRVEEADTTTLIDPVVAFAEASEPGRRHPSNADNATKFIFADANKVSDREVERFFGSTMVKSPPDSSKAPTGYFIIDALERGASRLEREQNLTDTYSELYVHPSRDLLSDRTPGGPSAIAQYSGRVWYAGFSGSVIDGDDKSPRMSSYLLFSQVVQNPADINLCYQQADPTSVDDSSLVDTDGGFIKLDGAYDIQALVTVDSSLFVLARNGVWRIVGVDNNTFTATSYSVHKISRHGCVSKNSVVVNNQTIGYWGENAIYGVSMNQTGDWSVTDLTETTIQRLYDEISEADKTNAIGFFDFDQSAMRWIYGADTENITQSKELILDLRFNAFTKNLVNNGSTFGLFTVAGGANPISELDITVTVDGVAVTVSSDDVTVDATVVQRQKRRSIYTTLTQFSTKIAYTFSNYNDVNHTNDWYAIDSVGVDSPAYLLSGSITGGDARLNKDVPYLATYFSQTTDDKDSSCFMKAQWDWTTNIDTGKWTSPRQIYRKRRTENDGGILPIRSKVRGIGRSVAFYFESEEEKQMHIFGWEYNLQASENE